VEYLPDALVVVGLGLLAAGAAMVFGLAWALMVVGVVLLAIGIVAAWKQR
jgi:hypothetical protein